MFLLRDAARGLLFFIPFVSYALSTFAVFAMGKWEGDQGTPL